MGVKSTLGSHGGTRQTGEGRLGSEQRNRNDSDDLEEPFHQLQDDCDWLDDPCQVRQIANTELAEYLRDRI